MAANIRKGEYKMEFELETRYDRCKALLHAAEKVTFSNDKEALLWIFEEEFERLGEAIEKAQSKSA